MPVLILLVPADLHDLARIAAASRQQSVNAWVASAMRAALLHQAQRDPAVAAILDRPGTELPGTESPNTIVGVEHANARRRRARRS